MTEENKKVEQEQEERTFSFGPDGKEYKESELNEEQSVLFNKRGFVENQRIQFLNQKADADVKMNLEIEKCELYLQIVSNQLKESLEGKTKIIKESK